MRQRFPDPEAPTMRSTKIVLLTLLLSAATLVPRQLAGQTSHEAATAELIEVLQMREVTESSRDMMVETMLAQNPMLQGMQDIFIDFFNEFLVWEEIQPEYVRLYMDAYTESEIRELIEFYETPVGRKTVELMPVLMQQGAEIGQRIIEPHLPELQRRVEARINGGGGLR